MVQENYVIKKGINKGKDCKMKISENTSVSMPIRNMAMIIAQLLWVYLHIQKLLLD